MAQGQDPDFTWMLSGKRHERDEVFSPLNDADFFVALDRNFVAGRAASFSGAAAGAGGYWPLSMSGGPF